MERLLLWMEMTRQRMVRAFQRLDADGNGQVTKDEIDKPIAMMFGHLDRDGDGQITREELRQRGPPAGIAAASADISA